MLKLEITFCILDCNFIKFLLPKEQKSITIHLNEDLIVCLNTTMARGANIIITFIVHSHFKPILSCDQKGVAKASFMFTVGSVSFPQQFSHVNR